MFYPSLHRTLRKLGAFCPKLSQDSPLTPLKTALYCGGIGVLLAGLMISTLEHRLRPLVTTIAQAQATNLLSHTMGDSISAQNIDYSQFITIKQNNQGEITALTTNMTAMNQMRGQLVAGVLQSLEDVDVSIIEIPIGSLFEFELLWATGPTIKARSMTVGTISAQFHSEFAQAGINQTIHRIHLEISAPIQLMLAGDTLETTVESQICLSETVIVGSVPDTNLQMGTSFLESSLTFTPTETTY